MTLDVSKCAFFKSVRRWWDTLQVQVKIKPLDRSDEQKGRPSVVMNAE